MILQEELQRRYHDAREDGAAETAATYRTLAEVSPAVHTLATKQFDDYVKRARIFVQPSLAEELRAIPTLDPLLEEAIQ